MNALRPPVGSLAELLAKDDRRVLVLDDDPTGTQTSSEVDVLLRTDEPALSAWFATGDRAAFVLTNTRSLSAHDAVQRLGDLRRAAVSAAAARNEGVAFVLRGDSTLRGHVFPEMDVFRGPGSARLLVPAFPEGGRVTLDGVQYVRIGRTLRPASTTEFARDPVFGYSSEDLAGWVRERRGGRVRGLGLAELHADGAAAVARALLEADDDEVVVPDAATPSDVGLIAAGLLGAEHAGRSVVARGSATLAAARIGAVARLVDRLGVSVGGRCLVVCGSHTEASSEQVARLGTLVGEPVVLPVAQVLDGQVDDAVVAAVRETGSVLRGRGCALLVTSRVREPRHRSLEDGARVMRALTRIVRELVPELDVVVAKGGITSAEVATEGLGATSARVLGQLVPGVPVWLLRASGRDMPFVIVPGNVGDPDTLVRAFEVATGQDARTA